MGIAIVEERRAGSKFQQKEKTLFRWSKWTDTEIAGIAEVEAWDATLWAAVQDGSWVELDDCIYHRRHQLVERFKIQEMMKNRPMPVLCTECGSILQHEISGDILARTEVFCPKVGCPNSNGQVLYTERMYGGGQSAAEEEIGKAPTHRGLFDDNKGSKQSPTLLHRIAQDAHGFFNMQTPEGRVKLMRAQSELRRRVSVDEDPVLHYARELLSHHNMCTMRLSKERFSLVCDKTISVIEKTQRQEGSIPRRVVRRAMSDILKMWGFPPLPTEVVEEVV